MLRQAGWCERRRRAWEVLRTLPSSHVTMQYATKLKTSRPIMPFCILLAENMAARVYVAEQW